MLNKKNLLVIAPHYKAFIKDSIECQSKFFEHINVIIPLNPINNIFIKINMNDQLNMVTNYLGRSIIDYSNKPQNVSLWIFNSFYYIPINIIDKLGLFSITNLLANNIIKYIQKKNLKFDIIHAHFTFPCGYIGLLIKQRFKKPLVVTGHGYDVYSLPFRDGIWYDIIRRTLNNADHVITVSNKNKIYLDKLDIYSPISIIPNGFRTDLFHLRDQIECRKIIGIPLDIKIILSVGNLVEIKGHKHLIDAVYKITSFRKDILCIIVGSGKLRGALERQISSIQLERHVVLAGGKPHDEIPIWMGACDLFVLPSLNEGNPTVMVEALGCGKPFIGTKVGGVPEIIQSEECGLLAQPMDSGALAEKINLGLNKNWNVSSILSYAEEYSWENIAQQIMMILTNASLKN